ncbi:MAG: YncE family protein [Acidobacteriota bacterium]|nr:YncE family protein [Acidobacteriota bacterium]
MKKVLTRREAIQATLGAGLVSALGCRRKKALGFSGYAFVANQEGNSVAAVDLEVFAVARHIHLDASPTQVLAGRMAAWALTPDTGSIHEIRADTLTFSRKVRIAAAAAGALMAPDNQAIYVLCRDPRKLVKLAAPSLKTVWEAPLAGDATHFDVAPDGNTIAVSYGVRRSIGFFEAGSGRPYPAVDAPGEIGAVRFQADSSQLLAANREGHELAVFQTATRKLVVTLPLSLRPDCLCFSADGGQLFVTGEGMDGVVVVYPYYTPQIGETVLAGHTPGVMAASKLPGKGYLFVANPSSGDVSILSIDTQRVVAVTPVGTDPGSITITPDDQYALVLNRVSGDMAVLRIANITKAVSQQRRSRKAPLFMLIPVGSKPVSAAVVGI